MFKWKDEFRLGIDDLDEQHKKIFDIANEAYELLKNEFYYDKYDRIVEILKSSKITPGSTFPMKRTTCRV